MPIVRAIVTAVAVGLLLATVPPAVVAQPALSAADADGLKAAIKALERGKRAKARKLATRIKDPIAGKLVDWIRLSEPDPKADFAEIAAFLKANPQWPSRHTLRQRAEEAMDGVADDVALDWLTIHPPLSGDGMARFGMALLGTGDEAGGIARIRDAWREGNFTKVRERAFYKRYRKHLSLEDHRHRLNRLLWDGRYWPIRRMLWKVDPEYRALATARMMLRFDRGNVDKAIAKVPAKLKSDPGLVYERLRWRRRKGKYASARELLDTPPDTLVRPEKWWVERGFLARRALRDGAVTDAYRLAREHGLDNGASYADGEWLAGWIALRFLDDAPRAFEHFVRMYNNVSYPVSRARGAYWAARAKQHAGDADLARWWNQRAAEFPQVYYGQLSISRLDPGAKLALPPSPEADAETAARFQAHEVARAVRILRAVEQQDRMRPFILALERVSDDPGWRRLTAELARDNGRPDLSVLVAKRAAREGMPIADLAFPTVILPHIEAGPGRSSLEVPLVLAVIRQESAFNVKARSHANAQGLMQLIPRTAYRVAKQLHVPFSRHRLTTDGAYNLLLGRTYLAGLLEEFNGSYVLALAAYNAGPARVRRWLRDHGDPREREIDSIDWVEMIPFRETRNYLQRVLENVQVYRARLSETEIALGIARDLHQ